MLTIKTQKRVKKGPKWVKIHPTGTPTPPKSFQSIFFDFLDPQMGEWGGTLRTPTDTNLLPWKLRGYGMAGPCVSPVMLPAMRQNFVKGLLLSKN